MPNGNCMAMRVGGLHQTNSFVTFLLNATLAIHLNANKSKY